VTADGAGWRVENQLPYAAFVSIVAEDRLWTVGAMRSGEVKVLLPASIEGELDGVPSDMPDLVVATDEEVSRAVEPWFARSGRGRGALDVAWHRPVAIAVVRAPVVPVVLEGVDPAVQRVSVLRFPIAKALIAPHVSAVEPVLLGDDRPLLTGTKVEIRAVSRDDGEYPSRAKWKGKVCYVEYDLYASERRWYGGNLKCDGTSQYFSKVALAVIERPVPWALGYEFAAGGGVKVVDIGPGDPLFAERSKWAGKRCTSESLYASAPLGWQSGGLVCDGTTMYFSQVYAQPDPLPATWAPALAPKTPVLFQEIAGDDPLSYAVGAPAIGSTCTVEVANPGDQGWYGGRLLCGGAYVDVVRVKLVPVPTPVPAP